MRISDWSSDVCSSDLRAAELGAQHLGDAERTGLGHGLGELCVLHVAELLGRPAAEAILSEARLPHRPAHLAHEDGTESPSGLLQLPALGGPSSPGTPSARRAGTGAQSVNVRRSL